MRLCMHLAKVGEPGSPSTSAYAQPGPTSFQVPSCKEVRVLLPEVRRCGWPAQDTSCRKRNVYIYISVHVRTGLPYCAARKCYAAVYLRCIALSTLYITSSHDEGDFMARA